MEHIWKMVICFNLHELDKNVMHFDFQISLKTLPLAVESFYNINWFRKSWVPHISLTNTLTTDHLLGVATSVRHSVFVHQQMALL